MRLEETVFAEVVQAVGGVAGPDESPRRRRAERYHCVTDVWVTPDGVTNPVPRQVKLTNISATGICMIDKMNLAIGQHFIVSLPRANGLDLNVICTVRQSRVGAAGFSTGAEFTGEAEIEERLISGVNGVVAKAPGDAGTRIPARLAIRSGVPGHPAHLFPAVVRETRADRVVLDTHVQLVPGTELIVEMNPGKPDRHVILCMVQGLLSIGSHEYRATLKRLASDVSRRWNLFGWLRRR